MNTPTKSIVVEFTPTQSLQVDRLLRSLQPGETVVAQVFGDGMRVAKLTKDQSNAFAASLGGYRSDDTHNSAFEAQAAVERRSNLN